MEAEGIKEEYLIMKEAQKGLIDPNKVKQQQMLDKVRDHLFGKLKCKRKTKKQKNKELAELQMVGKNYKGIQEHNK